MTEFSKKVQSGWMQNDERLAHIEAVADEVLDQRQAESSSIPDIHSQSVDLISSQLDTGDKDTF